MGGLIQRWRGGEDGDTPQRRTLYVFGAVVVFGLIGLAVVAISDLVGGDDDATGTSVQTEQANEDGGGDAATPAADGDAGTEQAVNDAVEEATAAADDAVDEGTDAPPPTTLTPTDLPPPNIRSLFRQAVPSIDPTGGGTYDAVSFVKLNDQPADLDLEVRFVRNGDTCYVGVDLFDKVPDSMELDTFLPSGVQIPGHDYGVKGKPQPA